MTSSSKIAPFLRWVGGKSAQVDRIIPHLWLDDDAQVYVEAFLGGGSVFFALASQGLLPPRVILNDANPRLVECYRAVQSDVDSVLKAFDELPWGPEYVENFDMIRGEFNQAVQVGPLHAARMIWLNRHCFNAVWRENRSGGMNAPVGLDSLGRPKAAQRPDPEALRRCAEALRGVEIHQGDFDLVLSTDLGPGLRVYADPPYVPRNVTGTDTFVSYTGEGFDAEDQWRLATRLRALAGTGAGVVASNHDLPSVRELYLGFDVEPIAARRSLNRNGDGRGPVEEALFFAHGPVPGEVSSKPSTKPSRRTGASMSRSTNPNPSPSNPTPSPKKVTKVTPSPAIVRELHTNLRAVAGRPRKIALGRHNVIVGKNDAGRSRILQSLEIVLTKKADDLFQRREIDRISDLLFLLPEGEDRLSVQAEFDAEGPLAGQVALFSIDTTTEQIGKRNHVIPHGVSTEWLQPVRRLTETFRQGPAAARKLLLPFVFGSLKVSEIRSPFPPEYTDTTLPHQGVLPHDVDSLIEAKAQASRRATEEAQRAASAKAVVEQLSVDLDPEPSDTDLAAARAVVEHARKALEASAQPQSARQKALLQSMREQLVEAESQIDVVAPKPPPLPDETATTVALIRKSADLVQIATQHNLPTCPGCGREATAKLYVTWLPTLKAYLEQFRPQIEAFEAASTQRAQVEEAIADLRRRIEDLEALIEGDQNESGSRSLNDAREDLDTAQSLFTTLLQHRQKWETVRDATAVERQAQQASTWWYTYEGVLDKVVEDLLASSIDAFQARVQAHLPPDRRFSITFRNGGCRIGLERDGITHTTLPGFEEDEDALIWLAMAAAVLDLLPDGPPAYALLASEKTWDDEALGRAMRALSDVPYQIVLTSAVAPKRPPKGWNLLDLDTRVETSSGAEPEAESGAESGSVVPPVIGEAK